MTWPLMTLHKWVTGVSKPNEFQYPLTGRFDWNERSAAVDAVPIEATRELTATIQEVTGEHVEIASLYVRLSY